MITVKCIRNKIDEHFYYPELKIGEEYAVTNISVGQSYSTVYILINEQEYGYNTILFEFYENGKPFKFLEDPRFNPYLSKLV